jgi:protein-S-isoprenylcysteine O-methyltransferase Ste14
VPPLYISDGPSAAMFWLLFAAWGVFELVLAFRARPNPMVRNRDRRSRIVLVASFWAGILLGFAAAVRFESAAVPVARHPLFYAGIVLLVAGVTLRLWSILTLGDLHTLHVTTRSGQRVVEDGPYRWIRHPSYSGSLLTALGILVCATNWLSLVCFVPVIIGYVYRIRIEESALVIDLGTPYSDYVKRTKRVIPHLL